MMVLTPYWTCQFQGFYTIARKEIMRFMRIFIQTLLPAPIMAFLYLMVFTQAFANGSADYSIFMSPGLIFMSLINNSFSNTVSSVFSAKFQKYMEELLVSPIDPVVVLLGFTIGGVARGLLIGLGIYFISLGFAPYSIVHLGAVCALAVLSASLFALMGIGNAIFAEKFDDINIFPTFILTPMIYLGGVFYSLDDVHGWLYNVTLYNPLYYLIATFREAMIQPLWTMPIHIVLGTLVFSNIVMFCVNWLFLLRRVGMGTS